ncbi:MAG: pyruvate dehydrogenase (acetyl-transferring) E1 component subunit alpha [Candidatus Obscuribacterales bacterium]|nr:pyruvate dehydrogenase (acetyl-transferring) E1 component subunit alpha [Candidatus Obscuribacterales bacterium]
MPRTPIDVPHKLEYLSILNENGEVDSKLEPKIEAKQLKEMYRWMLFARRVDERLLKLQRQGRIGTFPQASGHEAISLGSVVNLQKSDWHVPAYRELAGFLYRGWTLEQILIYWMGYEEGAVPPEGTNDLPISVPIASQLLHAAGIGMANNLKGDKNVVMTYFGDGASSEGDCHEAMNFAAVYQAPVVFVCLNNQYAISVPLTKQMRNQTIAQRALSYGMDGIRVDGNDVLAVYVAAKEAVDKARNGGGPTLIEALTYRYTPHTTADDPTRYRSTDECNTWMAKEPLIRFEKYLKAKKVVTDADLKTMEAEIEARIDEAITNAEEACKHPPLSDPLKMFDYLYSELPSNLVEQKEELAKHLGIEVTEKETRDEAGAVGRGK